MDRKTVWYLADGGSGHRLLTTFATMVLALSVLACDAHATTTYTLENEVELLDPSFYSQEPSGKISLNAAMSNDGTKVVLAALDLATITTEFYVVDVGAPSSYRRLLESVTFPLSSEPLIWSWDDSHVMVYQFTIDIVNDTVVDDTDYWHNLSGFGIYFLSSGATRKPTNNWRCVVSNTTENRPGDRELVLLPILPNGAPDATREAVQITAMDITASDYTIYTPIMSADGTVVTFMYADRTIGENRVKVIKNVDQIVAAKQPGVLASPLAPTSINDPQVIDIDGAINTPFQATALSRNKSLVYITKDFNGAFSDENPLGTLPLSDFDLVVAPSDGSSTGYRIVQPGNQFLLSGTPDGTRVLYSKDVGGLTRMFYATLKANTVLTGTPEGDNGVRLESPVEAEDGSNTSVVMPANTLVSFPMGAPQEVTIQTPTEVVSQAALPVGGNNEPIVGAIPVVRDFGPDGTTFSPPIEIVMAYDDAQIGEADELDLRLFLYNEVTGVFDIEIPDADDVPAETVLKIVTRDIVNNTITFQTDHFSQYGIGVPAPVEELPTGRLWSLTAIAGCIIALAAFCLRTVRP